MTRFGKAMLCDCVAVLRVFIDVAIRFDRNPLAAIAEVPGLIAEGRAEASHFESNWIARADVRRRRKGRMNRGRQAVRRRLVDNQHRGKVVIHLATRVSDFEDFAVLTGLGVRSFHHRAARRGAVRERPVVARYFARSAPRLRTVESNFVARENKVMRPGHRDDFGSVLPLVSFPKKGVALLNAPQAGRLPAGDVEVQMRPAAAPAFLAQHTDFLSQSDLRAGTQGGIDGLKMAVAIIPAPVVEQINDVVPGLHRAVIVAGQDLFPRRNHAPGGGRDHLHHSFRAAAVESVMVINFFVARRFAAIDERWLVRHLGVTGEPALFERINERARFDPGRTCGPKPQARVFHQAPGIALAAVGDVTLGNRTIDLDTGERHRQMIRRRGEDQRLAVEFDFDSRLAHRVA